MTFLKYYQSYFKGYSIASIFVHAFLKLFSMGINCRKKLPFLTFELPQNLKTENQNAHSKYETFLKIKYCKKEIN